MYKPELTIQEILAHIEKELKYLRLLFGIAIVILALVLAIMVPVLMPSVLNMLSRNSMPAGMQVTHPHEMMPSNTAAMVPATTTNTELK